MSYQENENIVFNNHVYRVCYMGTVKRCCLQCETLYLLGEIKLSEVKITRGRAPFCTEHLNEYNLVIKV